MTDEGRGVITGRRLGEPKPAEAATGWIEPPVPSGF